MTESLQNRAHLAFAPSNIALVKYMGKENAEFNIPANSSLSLTLNSLHTSAEIRVVKAAERSSRWVPELPETGQETQRGFPVHVPHLSDSGIARILKHVDRVRNQAPALFARFGLGESTSEGCFELRTANTFPAAAGVASSASSFAAVTIATASACSLDPKKFACAWKNQIDFRRAWAQVARQGSGSSCRSMEGPWVLWEHEFAAAIGARMPEMTDFVLLIGESPKQVSSSQAHALVKTSPLWEGRAERAVMRIRLLLAALAEGDIKSVSRIAWAEMWEMHSLFHTCAEPFTYWEPGTVAVLNWVRPWLSVETPPIVTMDAGANVHILVPSTAAEKWRGEIQQTFPGFRCLEDRQGQGAALGAWQEA